MRYFDIPVLRSFLLIAEGKSFAEAASVVGRSASAITQQIKKLEEDIGARVFVRSARHVGLTPDGERLIAHAQRLLLLHDEAMMAFIDAPGKTLRLGITQDIADLAASAIVEAFRHEWPDLALEIRVDRAETLIAQARNQQLDLSIAGNRDDANTTHALVIANVPMLWLGTPSFPTLASSTSERIPVAMLSEPCMFRTAALEALSTSSFYGDILFSGPSLQGVLDFCALGHAITARTPHAMRRSNLVDIGEQFGLPELPSVSYAAYSATKELSDPKDMLIDFIGRQLSLEPPPLQTISVSDEIMVPAAN